MIILASFGNMDVYQKKSLSEYIKLAGDAGKN
jgi:hypothetical protein